MSPAHWHIYLVIKRVSVISIIIFSFFYVYALVNAAAVIQGFQVLVTSAFAVLRVMYPNLCVTFQSLCTCIVHFFKRYVIYVPWTCLFQLLCLLWNLPNLLTSSLLLLKFWRIIIAVIENASLLKMQFIQYILNVVAMLNCFIVIYYTFLNLNRIFSVG